MNTKICNTCKTELDVSCFYRNKNKSDGYDSICKTCNENARKKFTNTCPVCGIVFKAGKKEQIHCSKKCLGASQKVSNKGEKSPRYTKVLHKCDGCGKEHRVTKSIVENQKRVYCSNDCYKKNCGKFKIGVLVKNVEVKCYTCGKQFCRKPHQVKKDKKFFCSHQCYLNIVGELQTQKHAHTRVYTNCATCGKSITYGRASKKNYKHVYCSKECKNKGYSLLYSGENNHGWDPSRTYEERIKERSCFDYKHWRSCVYKRDNYTCRCCSDNQGGNLVAHHLESYTANKDLRFDVDNGITLCKKCHVKFHKSYGYKNNTKQQFDEWLKSRTVI